MSYYQGDADLPPGYSSRYSPPPTEQRPPSPGPSQRDTAGGPVVYDYSHGGGGDSRRGGGSDDRRGRGAPGRPPSPSGGGTYGEYPSDVKPNIDRHTGFVEDGRRGQPRPGYDQKSRRPRSPNDPYYQHPRPQDGGYPTPPPHRGGRGDHHQSRSRTRPQEAVPSPPPVRRRIPSPTELYGPPQPAVPYDRYGAQPPPPVRRDDRYDHGRHPGHVDRSPTPSSHLRRRSPPSPRRMRGGDPHQGVARDPYYPDPRDPAHPPSRDGPTPPARFGRERSPLPHHTQQAPPPRRLSPGGREVYPSEAARARREESPPPHRRKTDRGSPQPNRDYYSHSSPAPFDAPPLRRASPPPQAYREPGPYSPPPQHQQQPPPAQHPVRRQTPSPYRTPSPPKREAFGHNLENVRGGRSPSPRAPLLPEQFKGTRNSRERLPVSEPYRPEYDRGRTPPPQHPGQQIPPQQQQQQQHARKMPRSPSGSPTRQHRPSSKLHHGQLFEHPQVQPAKRPRSPSVEKPAPFDDPDYPEGICKEWFDTGICRKPIGGCFMAHSLPESPVSKHRRKKYSDKEKEVAGHERRGSREQHVDDAGRAARKAEKKGASAHALPGDEPYAAPPPHSRPPPEADQAYRRERERETEEDSKEAKKLCREWAVGACDSANKKCRRRHYFINDEADYYNDISATANALASEQRLPQSSEEDSEWVSWISDQTRSWQVQKRVNEQRAEEDRQAGQSDATTAIMRRQMEEYQQQMQTWMVEMNDWMKTQTLTQDKLKEMRQMIKQQMEQVRQVAESAEFMATHGPGNVPGAPESSSASQAVATATGQHPQAPPYGAPPTGLPRPTTPGMAPPKSNPISVGPHSSGLSSSQPLRPEGLSLPPPNGMPPFDPMRPPPMFQPGRGPPPQALPPSFQPHNPPPGYAKPIGVNTGPPSAGGPPLRPDMGSPPMAHPRAHPDEGSNYDDATNDSSQKYKPCFNFRRGKCPMTEESCPYSHSIERKDKPCIAYNQASCRFDNDCCTYQHVCKNCGGPNPAIQCGCGQERSPDELKPPMIERVKKRFYWKEMERVAKDRGEKGELWRNNRSPSPDICVKWNEKGMGQCPLNDSCRYLHRCKSCWGPDPYYNCVRCNGNAKDGGAKPCPHFATQLGCKLGLGCAMAHYCSTCKASFLEHSGDCRCNPQTEPEDSDAQRGVPKSKGSEEGASGGADNVIVKFIKEERQDSTTPNDAFPKDVCRMFNLGICKNANCPQQHKCAKCLKHGLNQMTCNCVGAKDFRNTISSGVKKEEPKKPDLPLGGCIKFNLGSCSEECTSGHHCAICLGKNAAKICACQGAKDLRKALVTLEEMELRKTKKNAVRLETRGWPDKICRNFNLGTCSKQDCTMSHACVKCSSSSPITTCNCENSRIFQADVEGKTEEMDDVTTQIKVKPEKSTDLNYGRGGWPRGVCKNFNSGTCPFPTCKYFHKCAKCMGPDPMQSCACFGGEDFRENPTLEREMMDALTLYDLNISTLLNCAQKIKEDEARATRGEAQEENGENGGKDDVDNDGWSYVREICQAYNALGCDEGTECKKRHVCIDCLGPFPRAKSHKCKGSIKDKFVCKDFQTGQCMRGGRCPFPHRCHDCQGPVPRAKCIPCINKLGPYPPRNRIKDGPPRPPGPPRPSGPPRSAGPPRPGPPRPGPPHSGPPMSGPPRPAGPPPRFTGPPPRLSAPPPGGPFRPPPMSHPPPSSAAPSPSSILGVFPGTPGILGAAPGGPPPIRGPPPGMVRPGMPPPRHLQPHMMDSPHIRPNGAGHYPPRHGMNGANGRGHSPSGIVLDSAHEHRRPPPPHHRMDDPYYSRRPMGRDDDGAEPESSMSYEGAMPERMEPDFTEDDVDPSSAVGFANDGSFAEFAQGVIQQQKKEHPKHGTPLPSGLNKRVGGKALKTGMVIKSKKPEDKPKDGAKDDAWSKYMEEVKRMSGGVCERGGGGNSSLAQ